MMSHASILAMIERDRAARTCDPATLTEGEKNAKVLALQARNAELEQICDYLATRIIGIERETLGAGADDRSYRGRVLALCADLRNCAMPVTIVEPVTGADMPVRRSL